MNQEEKEKQEGYTPESDNCSFRKYIDALHEQEFRIAEEEFFDELEGNGFCFYKTEYDFSNN